MKEPLAIITSLGDLVLKSTPKASEELHIQLEVLAQLNQAVVVLDKEEHIILWNKMAEHLYKYSSDEVIGRRLSESQNHFWIKPADQAQATQDLKALGSWQGENLHFSKNGNEIQVKMSLSLLKDSLGQTQGLIFLIQDISPYTQALNEVNSQMICRFLPDFTISYANNAFCTALGLEANSLVNKSLLNCLAPDFLTTLEEKLKLLNLENPLAIQEEPMFLSDGTIHWVQWTHRAVFNADGLLLEYQSVGGDRTLYQELQKALEQSERNYRSLFNKMHEGFALLELLRDDEQEPYDFRYLEVNPAFERIYGLPRQQVVGKTGYDILLPEEVVFRTRIYGEVAQTGKPAYFQKFVTGIDKYFEVIAFRPGPGQCAALFIDITERQQVKQALAEIERRMANILNFLPDATMVVNSEGQLMVWNKAAEDMTGIKAQDIVYQDNYEYAIPLYGYRRPLLMDLVLQPSKEWEKDYSFLQRKGDLLMGENFCQAVGENGAFLRATAAPLYDSRGNIVGAIESLRDITQRRKAELALQSSEEKYRRIVETANEGILVLDEDDTIAFANYKMALMLGYQPDKLLAMPLLELVEESDLQPTKSILHKIRHEDEEQSEFDIKLKTQAGNPFYGICSITNIYDHLGKYTGCLAMITDITARKKLEEEMIQLDRLNLVGQIAAGIGHEIRNPMTAVRGYLQFLNNEKAFRPYREIFDLMIEEIDRGNSIITEFLLLARNKAVELESSNLNLIIEALFPLIRVDAVSCDKNIQLELGQVQPLFLDKKEIRQLVLNLVRNGLEAMGTGGTVTIKTYLESGEVVLAVSDQGPGIDQELISRVGTPFFTTKDQGTGLGLPICYGIASRHNAEIDIQTSPLGTTFLVRFKPQIGS